MWTFFEKQPFFQADIAGLGKYHMGGCGRIGVYKVNKVSPLSVLTAAVGSVGDDHGCDLVDGAQVHSPPGVGLSQGQGKPSDKGRAEVPIYGLFRESLPRQVHRALIDSAIHL